MGLVHQFTSGKAAAADATVVDGPNWDADHYFTGGNLGALLYQGTAGLITGINSVATGQVLTSAGAGSVPTWSASPTVTSIKASTSFGSASTTGTLLTNDSQTVANDAVINIGDSTSLGYAFIHIETEGSGVIELRGGAAPLEVIDAGLLFSITKDTASMVNVYWETANYKLQNKRGGSRNIRIERLGV